MLTNINITNNIDNYTYIIEYESVNDTVCNGSELAYINNHYFDDDKNTYFDDIILLRNDDTKYIKYYNHWYPIPIDNDKQIRMTDDLPLTYKTGKLRLYFPQHSVDTYNTGHKYALTVTTWICGNCVVLGSYIINRFDALACSKIKNINNILYYECIEFDMIDPLSLLYSDSWKNWRQKICNESTNPDMVNSVGSILYCTLYPVIESNDGYIKLDGYEGGQNSINITDDEKDFLKLNISANIHKPLKRNERPAINCKLDFNKYYNGDLGDYLKETYGGDQVYKIQYELVIGNEDELYVVNTSPLLVPTNTYSFTKDVITSQNFQNGIGWKPGISIVCSANIVNLDGDSILYLLSNKIPLTEDVFRYFVGEDFIDKHEYIVNNVNIDEVDMNFLNLNIVNKIENNVIQIDKHINDKSGVMIQPVFFKMVDASNIIIHPEVIETICINLDQYKSNVKTFIIQIEGVKFIEYGKNNSGVLFKIVGNKLPGVSTTGTYYILNQDSELVTTGKYTYVK